MIDEVVKVHDRFSIEIKLGYATRRTQKENDYAVNIWFFVPNSLDINRYTYSARDFYNDLKSNIRLITPVYLLREIASGTNSPFKHLEQSFKNLSSSPIRKNVSDYEYHIKMFQSILKSSLRDEIQHIIKNDVKEDTSFLVKAYVNNVNIITERYRELRRIINAPTVQKELMRYYFYGDEFMSNIVEQNTLILLTEFKQKEYDDFAKSKKLLYELIVKEREYKKEKEYPLVEKHSKDSYRELIHRRGVLKKYVESQLFLSTSTKKDGVLVEQILYSLAAGLAMIFATAVAFTFQQKFGNFTMPLFIALVISYMLKDRIKELMRYYLMGSLKRFFFDQKTDIKVKNDHTIGWCKEGFDFLIERKVPKEVVKARNRSLIMGVENRVTAEKVFLYRKFLRLSRNELNKVYQHYTITGVNDIIRFNISRFISKMDNPEIPLYLVNHSHYEVIYGEKVYYMNMVISYQFEGSTHYSRYRLVFNRDGIKELVKC
ncbi:MAG: hypothetical protein AB7S48_16250 [Bacteroidales bacterium]